MFFLKRDNGKNNFKAQQNKNDNTLTTKKNNDPLTCNIFELGLAVF